MNVEDCYYLGYTSKVHGKQGELIVKLDVDFPEEYKNLESVFVQMNKKDNSLVPFFIDDVHLKNDGTLRIKIENINTIPEAKSLVGKQLFLSLNSLTPLTGNNFYYHEVIGFKVIDNEKGNIGRIARVLDYPTQAILEIENDHSQEILIPIVDDIIINLDRENKTMKVDTPKGLIDVYLT